MALSDEEQRLLEQMEAALAAEDPKLVNTLRGTGVRRIHRRRAAVAGVGFFLGLALLVAGISLEGEVMSVVVSALGFVVMVGSSVGFGTASAPAVACFAASAAAAFALAIACARAKKDGSADGVLARANLIGGEASDNVAADNPSAS